MTQAARPTQIATILKAIDTKYPDEIGASLEAYIAGLETRQPERPAQITAILKTIDTDHPLDIGMLLKAYISDLEARQQVALPGMNRSPSADSKNPPIWSHVRVAKREVRRRERRLKKQIYGQ
jgi:hypothetical protein